MKRVMQKVIFIYIALIVATAANAETRWVSAREHCSMLQQEGSVPSVSACMDHLVTPKGFMNVSHWAGTIVEYMYDLSAGAITYVKVQVTWRDSDSNYSCGSIVRVKLSEIRDFTHHSIRHHECN